MWQPLPQYFFIHEISVSHLHLPFRLFRLLLFDHLLFLLNNTIDDAAVWYGNSFTTLISLTHIHTHIYTLHTHTHTHMQTDRQAGRQTDIYFIRDEWSKVNGRLKCTSQNEGIDLFSILLENFKLSSKVFITQLVRLNYEWAVKLIWIIRNVKRLREYFHVTFFRIRNICCVENYIKFILIRFQKNIRIWTIHNLTYAIFFSSSIFLSFTTQRI